MHRTNKVVGVNADSGEFRYSKHGTRPALSKTLTRPEPVTVCAAALCKYAPPNMPAHDVVIGISDRMLTSGDIQFETRNRTKVFLFGQKIACLISGNTDIGFMMATDAHRRVLQDGISDTGVAARLFRESIAAHKNRIWENHVAMLGIDFAELLAQQQQNPDYILDLAGRTFDFSLDAIVAGMDWGGGHIYRIGQTGLETCCDGLGFVAIGSGGRQFETQFMLARYDRYWPFLEALFLVFSSKRRAEVSPGVGRGIDMFIIGHDTFVFVPPDVIEALKEYHKEFEETARNKWHEIFERMSKDGRINPGGRREPETPSEGPPSEGQPLPCLCPKCGGPAVLVHPDDFAFAGRGVEFVRCDRCGIFKDGESWFWGDAYERAME